MPPREILIANRHPRLRLDRRAVARMIHTLDANDSAFRPSPLAFRLESAALAAGELSLVFLTDAALAKLHADFLGDPTPTDVITFSGDPTLKTAGEICVSVDAARRQVSSRISRSKSAAPRRSTFDFSTELALYLVHGWLHLAGFDDLQPAKKRQMRRAEARVMKLLRDMDALPQFTLRRG